MTCGVTSPQTVAVEFSCCRGDRRRRLETKVPQRRFARSAYKTHEMRGSAGWEELYRGITGESEVKGHLSQERGQESGLEKSRGGEGECDVVFNC